MSDSEPAKSKLAAELEQLRSRYLESLQGELAEIAQCAAGLSGGESNRRAFAELHHRLHKVAGSAGTFGFEAVGDRARQLEARAQEWLESSLDGLDPAALGRFIDELEGLRGV